tara:strand:- start:3892 stop:4143 length:252 start_codon:yes stop_codon:yes gene_type:complete
MANILQTYFDIYFREIIMGVLILSIIIVLISIIFVFFNLKDNDVIKKIKKPKTTKMKYTKQFLQGVDGIDLNLNIENPKKIKK